MPGDPRKRQKKLQRLKAKRKEKKHIQVREQSGGLPERLTAAARFPVLHSWIGKSLDDRGMGQVGVSRAFPNGLVAVAAFLVDRYCLGVKDAFADVLPRADYESRYVQKMAEEMPVRWVSAAETRKLIEEAVAYAHSIGLSPHADYQRAMLLFGDVNPADSNAKFEFGQDGKPLFIAGPYDTPERCRQIQAILTNTCGVNGFHFVMPLGGGEFNLDGLEGDDLEEFEDFGEKRWSD